MGDRLIGNEKLSVDLIPGEDADYYLISQFTLTFEGYEHWGGFNQCAEIANRYKDMYMIDRGLPETLTLWRTCLFFEQRRFHHFGNEPKGKDLKYIKALLKAICTKVENNERD